MESANSCEPTLFLANWNHLFLDKSLSPGVLPSPQGLAVIPCGNSPDENQPQLHGYDQEQELQ